MIENLINLIKENAGELIVNNQAIANEHNDAAISETGNSIINGLKAEFSKGNIAGLSDILKTNENLTSNPIVANIISDLGNNLVSKFNVNQTDANHISSELIPNVMNQLISKINDPNDDSFNVQSMLSNIGGGGLSGMLINMFGPKNNNEEKGGLSGMFKNFLG
jgi:hypothetical protein